MATPVQTRGEPPHLRIKDKANNRRVDVRDTRSWGRLNGWFEIVILGAVDNSWIIGPVAAWRKEQDDSPA